MNKSDIRLLDENIVQYARHKFTCIALSDLGDFIDSERWDGLILDVRTLNTIFTPVFYWKRGTLRPHIVEKPRLYVAAINLNDKSLPSDASELEHLKLDGFRLKTKNVSKKSCYWQIEPIYQI